MAIALALARRDSPSWPTESRCLFLRSTDADANAAEQFDVTRINLQVKGNKIQHGNFRLRWPAVLRTSPNFKPCKRKSGRIPYDQFLDRIRKDRCTQCRDLLLQLGKELKTMAYLREHKN